MALRRKGTLLVVAGAIAFVSVGCDPEGLAGFLHEAESQLAPIVEHAAEQSHVSSSEVQKLADQWSDQLSGTLSDLAQKVGEADDATKGPARKVILGSFCDAMNAVKANGGALTQSDVAQMIGQNLVNEGLSTPPAQVQELAGRLYEAIEVDLQGNGIKDPVGDASRATMCAAAALP